ncbi:DUF4974 domain-containing protein [Bacteroidaceae bacterium HV4-6-C5C]|nr:DUF4974 domain-containing protein [Bacteroidaceae bacterium HV4-6-C5C]
MDRYWLSIDYSTYTFEDFLQNDFFVSSMKNPTADTEEFWHKFELSKPINLDEFIAAKKCLSIFSNPDILLSKNELRSLWTSIDLDNNAAAKPKFKDLKFIKWVAAACLLAFVAGFYFLKNKPIVENISSFALEAKASLPVSDETLLILSKNKVIRMDEQESNISYGSDEIKTNGLEIGKRETDYYNQLVIPPGKRSVLTFSDGTKVWANAGTRLIYPSEFRKEEREIYVDGEIYLEVAKDAKRPFYVRMKKMSVRVLGTKFNVNAYESEASCNVVLAEGKVEVRTSENQKAILKPNQMYALSGKKQNILQVNSANYTSWIHGLYNFEDANLGYVMKRLSTYYGINVICDPQLINIKCSGKIDVRKSFETVINDLAFVLPISCAYDKPHSTYKIMKK